MSNDDRWEEGSRSASVLACGNACIGLGQAIDGLAKAGLVLEAKELAEQLKLISKSLSWEMNLTTAGEPGPKSAKKLICDRSKRAAEIRKAAS